MRELNQKEVCAKQLELLKAVDRWCSEHGCTYFLAYGTLLGAVRHQGYIPWDDDVDIALLRPDYEKMIREFNRNRTDSFRLGHQSLDRAFPYEFAKVYDTQTRIVENVNYTYDIGVNIDVFVLDEVASPEEAAKMERRLKLPGFVLNAKMFFTNREMARQGRPRTGWKKLAAPFLRLFTHCFSVPWCTAKMDTIAKSGQGEWVGGFCERGFQSGQILKKEWFAHMVWQKFEDGEFPIPAEYDNILTAWYGDYRKLPPPEQRVTHHDYKAYAKNQ